MNAVLSTIVCPFVLFSLGYCIVCPFVLFSLDHCIVCPFVFFSLDHCIVCPSDERTNAMNHSKNISSKAGL
jgi:hypothetical protein